MENLTLKLALAHYGEIFIDEKYFLVKWVVSWRQKCVSRARTLFFV